MDEWLMANPHREKKNYERFIFNWLHREEGKILFQNGLKKLASSKTI